MTLDDLSRLHCSRIFWKSDRMRNRLIRHWTDSRHPYADSFEMNREVIESVLRSSLGNEALDAELRKRQTSLRVVVRMIPPCFGQFWKESL